MVIGYKGNEVLKNSFVNRLLMHIFLPAVCGESIYGKTDTPLIRTVRITSYVIRTPFHVFIACTIVLPIAGRHAGFLNILTLVGLFIGLFELIANKLYIDQVLEQLFKKYESQAQAEYIFQTNPGKAKLLSYLIISIFMIWNITCFFSIFFFVGR